MILKYLWLKIIVHSLLNKENQPEIQGSRKIRQFILKKWKAFVTSISLYQLVLLDALQLATRATGLFFQGVTAVVHGCSLHALGHNLGEETGFIMATLQEGSENARNHTRLHS